MLITFIKDKNDETFKIKSRDSKIISVKLVSNQGYQNITSLKK